ncbi:hybrid sensor histidine kinase/response regulator [Stutzerimonas azotifigens]|uniref:hybrid sensor histidine kinase/response regulator n=1 Tax=Stutzerimonas azotifigens TaxID=291995 RepID=UPI0004268E28|nr:response regulator [Stutzerimonas azotifigens]
MSLDRAALQQRLLEGFRAEARERLLVLADGLARWREAIADQASVESLFREVHSLKGASRSVGLSSIERICHAWESLLSAVRGGDLPLTPERVDICRQALAAVQMLNAGQPLDPDAQRQLIAQLEAASRGERVEPAPSVLDKASPVTESGIVRVPAKSLDALLFHGETLLQHKLEARALAQRLREHAQGFEIPRSRSLPGIHGWRQLREELEALPLASRDLLKGLFDYLDWGQAQLDRLHFQAINLEKASRQLAMGLSQLSDGHATEMLAVLLLPAGNLVEGIPAMAQDLASQAGKRVELRVNGTELQIDKRILDELRAPLTHLVRNAIDHGLESPSQREAVGKPPAGRVHIELVQESADRFSLCVRDDGCGLDIAVLKARALAMGLLTEDEAEALSEAEAYKLIFASGLSTSAMITELSGRGLGMPIVQEAIERIGGRIEVASLPGQGVDFRLDLPLSLSTFRAVIVRNAERIFAVPALAVERCLRLPPSAVRTLENRPSLVWEGQVLPVWPLADVLGLGRLAPDRDELTLLLLHVRGERFVLLVDELLGDQEITVKSLGLQLRRVRNLLGATVLGDGRLVPILHPVDLYRSALATDVSTLAHSSVERSAKRAQRLLIAEDSFTSRGLLKAILEAAGYQVATANDGLEAWNALKQEAFDLLVSDVEMPRMDGFALTDRVRADPELARLPVILVTALESAEDRARGLEAGANAYLVKSGFAQDSLLDTIRRLI